MVYTHEDIKASHAPINSPYYRYNTLPPQKAGTPFK